MKNAPTLEDFCEAANDLYAAPTEERFYVVVNLARDLIQSNQAKWDDGYRFGRSEVEKLQTAALLALGLLWMTERQSDKVHLAYTTLRDAWGGKEALRQGIQAAMDAGHEADHPHGADWWAGKDRAAALRAENEKLRTVMVAAAEEIAAHWQAHCDADGYGPANLMRHLEEGIPSEYGYTAGAFESLRAEVAALRADALRYQWLRSNCECMGWGSRSDAAIDAAMATPGVTVTTSDQPKEPR